MLLTEAQLHEIHDIIRDHHTAFVINTIGPDAVAPEILEDLKAKGLVNVQMSTMEEAYLYGQVLAALESPQAAVMSYDAFKEHMKKNPVPLSPVEKQAIQMAKLNAGQLAVGLGNRVSAKTGQLMIEADAKLRTKMRHEIKNKVSENIARRESVQKLKSDLGHATKDWARDWDRIAVTEKQTAMQTGLADHYSKKFGPDVLVAKRPMPDACQHCKRLHLGSDGLPRIFKLSELEKNGNNQGKKVADWLPTVGPVHPHCQCQLIRIPDGWGFNKDGDLVPGARGGYGDEDDEKSFDENDLIKALKSGTNIDFQGFAVHIENAVGSVRHWGSGEHAGTTRMQAAYGYLMDTQGADGEEIDCYIGDDETAENVYIVEQQNPHTGLYDEAKCMIGFESKDAAEAMYRIHYNRDDFMLYTTAMEVGQFTRWIYGTNERAHEGALYDISKPSEVPKRLHVVPLAKARVSSSEGARDSMAGARNPGPGTVTNFLVRTPVRKPAKPVEGLKEMLETGHGEDEREAVTRDPEIYDFNKPVPVEPRPVVLPENFGGVDDLGQGHAEERKADVVRRYKRNIPPGNPAEIEKPKFTISATKAAKPDEQK